MASWVRLHHDTPSNPKWRVISRRADSTICNVLAIWTTMLVCASKADPRGTIEDWSAEVTAAALDIDETECNAVKQAMEGMVVLDDKLMAWERRNPKREDDSTKRVQEFRARESAKKDVRNRPKQTETDCNGTKRPEQSRADTDKKNPLSPPEGGDDDLFGKEKKKSKRATSIPDNFPDDEALKQASKYFSENKRSDINIQTEADKFRDYALAKGKTYKDWRAAWRNWCRNALGYVKNNGNGVSRETPGVSPEKWARRLTSFHQSKAWSEDWGPCPGEAGCVVPGPVMDEFNKTRATT